MRVDSAHIDTLWADTELADVDTYVVNGVEIDLPKSNARGKARVRDWQRRILSDVMPDSVNADAAERTPFRLLYGLTTNQSTKASIEDALAGEFAPLEGVFRARSRGRKLMTLGFHVLAVKAAARGESDVKGYTERTLLLLCRRPDGTLDEALVRKLVEQFRRAPTELDLAQRTLLDLLSPDWSPEQEPHFSLPDASSAREVPFDQTACQLFQEDLRSLLGAALPPADFFHQLNLLLTLHLGLYQPRVASLLNPQMEYLYKAFDGGPEDLLQELQQKVRLGTDRHPFDGSLWCRAPDPELRTVTLRTPSRLSFEAVAKSLAVFHFNVLLLVQLRRLGEAYFASRWDQLDLWRAAKLSVDDAFELGSRVRTPAEFLRAFDEDPEYLTYLGRALEVLCVRFVRNQLADVAQEDAVEEVKSAPSPLHALRRLYEKYNSQTSRNPAQSRAYRQGTQVTSSLLKGGQYGLLQARPRVGPFFEVGANLLPLLILLAVGPGREKVPVDTFWKRLSNYGLAFDPGERERLLSRLRSMGVYERYSDAGEAAYVRNLITPAPAQEHAG